MKRAFLTADGERAVEIDVADGFLSRFVGLMGQKEIKRGLLLSPCSSIHTLFMKARIDVIYLDRAFQVLRVDASIAPWRLFGPVKGAHYTLELPSGDWERLNLAGKRLGIAAIGG